MWIKRPIRNKDIEFAKANLIEILEKYWYSADIKIFPNNNLCK